MYNVNTSKEISTGTYFQQKRLDPNFNMLSGVDHVGVYSALGTSRYFDFLGPLGTVNLAFAVPAASAADVERYRHILDLSNVRYVASKDPMTIRGFQCIHSGDPFLYKNDSCLPRAFVVPRAIGVKNGSALLDSIRSPLFDPRATVLIETDPGAAKVTEGAYTAAPMLRNEPGCVTIKADGPGWLVFTETYYPGWFARVDGREAAIYRGDYVFKTLPLGQGEHLVEFIYRSQSFQNGLIILSVTCFVVLLLLVIGQIKARPRKLISLFDK